MQFGLERMHDLLDQLGHPEAEFDAIHVVGTNGKSSTVRFCEALLEAEGVRTGAYLSPHITTFRERIRIGGETLVRGGLRARGARRARRRRQAGHAVRGADRGGAAARSRRRACEWAVVEAGLGGRLDATNVLPRSRVQVLTNVSLEHIELLGRHARGDRGREAGGRPGGRDRGVRGGRLGGAGAAGARVQAVARRRQLPGAEPGGGPGGGRGGARPAGRARADRAPRDARPARGARPATRSRSGTAPTTRPACSGWCRSCRRCSATAAAVGVFSALADKDVATMVSLLRDGVPDDRGHHQLEPAVAARPRTSPG